MNTPDDLRYTKDHEWVRLTGTAVRVGITDYAQDALGDIVFVQVPEVGASIGVNQSIAEIESTKSVNDVYAPVSGTISRVNEALQERPELLNTDPYGEGWIFEVENAKIDESVLLSAEQYIALVGG